MWAIMLSLKQQCRHFYYLNNSVRRFSPKWLLLHRSYSNMIISKVISEWTEKLTKSGVPEARLSTEHILAHVVNIPRHRLWTISEGTLKNEQMQQLDRLMTCRLSRMPVHYIVGEWDFHCVTLRMRPPVFIPRPETEQVVNIALERIKDLDNATVLEIGCGSGAISLALLKSVPNLQCVALDPSEQAINLAQENASALSVSDRLTLIKGKVTIDHLPPLPRDKFDLVVSNPPYVLRKDLLCLEPEVILYEDLRALDGGAQGLDVIKPILLQCQQLLEKGNSLLLEVDPCHSLLIPIWMEENKHLSYSLPEVHMDFNHKNRFLEFKKI